MTAKKSPLRRVQVRPGLTKKDGTKKVIRKALREYGGDYRAATYDSKTGRGTAR